MYYQPDAQRTNTLITLGSIPLLRQIQNNLRKACTAKVIDFTFALLRFSTDKNKLNRLKPTNNSK